MDIFAEYNIYFNLKEKKGFVLICTNKPLEFLLLLLLQLLAVCKSEIKRKISVENVHVDKSQILRKWMKWYFRERKREKSAKVVICIWIFTQKSWLLIKLKYGKRVEYTIITRSRATFWIFFFFSFLLCFASYT